MSFVMRALAGRRSFIVLGVMACSAIGSLAWADQPAPNRRAANFEVRFLKAMIDHHHMAVMMAELCVERAVNTELSGLCHDIIEAQSAEIEEMQSWLEDWYGVTYEPRMSRQMQKQMRQLEQLHVKRFEIAFMAMMIDHHSKAIREAEDCVDRAYHEELIELCETIIETQQAEIQLMRSCLCQWYGLCS